MRAAPALSKQSTWRMSTEPSRFQDTDQAGFAALVIQVFVCPDAWPTHRSWAVLLLCLAGRSAGTLLLDRLFRTRQMLFEC